MSDATLRARVLDTLRHGYRNPKILSVDRTNVGHQILVRVDFKHGTFPFRKKAEEVLSYQESA